MHGVGEECRKGSQEGQMSEVYVLLTHLHCSQSGAKEELPPPQHQGFV